MSLTVLPLRRVALRVLSARPSTSTLLSTTSRTFVTCAPQTVLSQRQWSLSRFQRRFASDEAQPSESTVTDETVTEEPSKEEQAAAAEVAAEQSISGEEGDVIVEQVESSRGPVTESVVSEAAAADSQDAVESASTSFAPPAASIAGAAAAGATAGVAQGSGQRPLRGPPEHAIPESNVLYVGNLFFESSEDDLRNFFEEFGAIEAARVVYDHRGLSKGFGYITFRDIADATRAVQARNQEVFQGRRVTVQYHRPRQSKDFTTPRQPNAPSKTLFIGNMSFEMSDKDLNDLFREIRNVLDVRVAIDRRSGQPRGFAHADFVDVASAMKAKEVLTDKEIYGRKLRVDYSISSSMQR